MKTQTTANPTSSTTTSSNTSMSAKAAPSTPQSAPPQLTPPSPARVGSDRKYKEVWLVEDAQGNRKAFWTRIGVAFENRDGSWNLRLAAVPTGNNTLNIRDPKPTEQQSDSASGEGPAVHDHKAAA